MSTLLETAMYWKRAGVATIPIQYRDKRPDARLLPKDKNGDPSWEPYQKELPTDDQLKRWFPSSLHNLGIVTGWNNLVVLDFDDLGTYLKWSLWMVRTGRLTRRIAELTYMVRTARGVHVYVRTQQPEQNRKLEGIDIKARGGYVLAPPSIHPSNVPYSILQPGSPMMVEALSDILPAAYLLQHTELPTMVNVPTQKPVSTDDPWEAINHAPDPKQDLIDQIRASFRIESFFPNATNTGGNRWFMDLCPFHDDKHPSFWIDTTRQICACYGGCTPKPLDVINLYARLHGLSNRDAIFFMAKQL
jgi:hypothetical protein